MRIQSVICNHQRCCVQAANKHSRNVLLLLTRSGSADEIIETIIPARKSRSIVVAIERLYSNARQESEVDHFLPSDIKARRSVVGSVASNARMNAS